MKLLPFGLLPDWKAEKQQGPQLEVVCRKGRRSPIQHRKDITRLIFTSSVYFVVYFEMVVLHPELGHS